MKKQTGERMVILDRKTGRPRYVLQGREIKDLDRPEESGSGSGQDLKDEDTEPDGGR